METKYDAYYEEELPYKMDYKELIEALEARGFGKEK